MRKRVIEASKLDISIFTIHSDRKALFVRQRAGHQNRNDGLVYLLYRGDQVHLVRVVQASHRLRPKNVGEE
jgi:hypothetical protein